MTDDKATFRKVDTVWTETPGLQIQVIDCGGTFEVRKIIVDGLNPNGAITEIIPIAAYRWNRLAERDALLRDLTNERVERVNNWAHAGRLILWISDPKRKPAITEFTEGPERQVAYAVERREDALLRAVRELRKAAKPFAHQCTGGQECWGRKCDNETLKEVLASTRHFESPHPKGRSIFKSHGDGE